MVDDTEQMSVIDYWDQEGISSFHSSTSRKDKYLAKCENHIETSLLETILDQYIEQSSHALDVGAGLGRFTFVLSNYFDHVDSIEPANQLYRQLSDNMAELTVSVHNTTLSEFSSNKNYDCIIVSGILYMYDEIQVKNFLHEVRSQLRDNGLIIIRDFIIEEGKENIPSDYFAGDCYYRDPSFWDQICKEANLQLRDIRQCSPFSTSIKSQQCFNIHKIIHDILSKTRLMWIISTRPVTNYLMNHTIKINECFEFSQGEIKTVFIIGQA